MIRLQPDTASQTFYVSPFEARKYLSTFTHYLIEFKSMATEEVFRVIGNILLDNERYTSFDINTSLNDVLNGDVKITESGLYIFKIYGQNSSVNLNPTDISVVGEVEKGTLQIVGEDAWDIPEISIPKNVVYYE